MARINITKTAVKNALEAYRGSRKINPYDPVKNNCVNYLRGRRCLVAQVLHDLGVEDKHLMEISGPASYTLARLHHRGVITNRSMNLMDWLNEVQAIADEGGPGWGPNKRLPWGKAVDRILAGEADHR